MKKYLLAFFFALCVQNVNAEVTPVESSKNIVTGTLDVSSHTSVGMGRGGARLRVGGTIASGYADFTTATTTTTPASGVVGFSTVTIPANTLSENGDCFIFRCHVRLANNGNNKSNIILVNGAILSSDERTDASAGYMKVITVCRQNASTMQWFAEILVVDSTSPEFRDQGSTSDALDFTAPINVACAGSGSTAGDVSFRYSKMVLER